MALVRPAAQASDAAARAALARPVTPGTVAQLIDHVEDPAVRVRLAELLNHAQAEVRSAAARVVFVSGLRGLEAQIAATLRGEVDPIAAVEQTRVLAYFGGPATDGVIADAWTRLGGRAVRTMPLILAGARGEAALPWLSRLPPIDAADPVPADFIRVATRGDRTALTSLLADAVKDANVALFRLGLQASLDAEVDVEQDVLEAALQASTARELRTAAVWHILGAMLDDDGRLAGRMESAVSTALASVREVDHASMFTVELANRALGRPPRTDPEWHTLLTQPSADLLPYLGLGASNRLLTGEELAPLIAALRTGPEAAFHMWIGAQANRAAARDAQPSDSLIRTASGYPHDFMASVIAETRCNLQRANAALAGSSGLLTLRRDGRVARMSFGSAGVPRDCQPAVRLLLMHYVADPGRVIGEGTEDLVMVPFLPDYVVCQQFLADAPRAPVRLAGNNPHAPKKVRDVRPVYPRSAQTSAVQGLVVLDALVTVTGCIARAEVIRSPDLRLDFSALRAVIGWRFEPMVLDGEPMATVVGITVQFSLR